MTLFEDERTEAGFDPRAAERALRDQLQGARLVAEVDLWGEPFEAAKRVMAHAVRARTQASAGRRYPASTAVYLVGEGVRHYDGGFWDHLSVPGAEPQVLRPAWKDALHRLELDDFLWAFEEKARPYVTPILFHGGIPAHCAGDVFRVINDELRRGASDAVDLMAGWRTNPTRFERLDKPARRFLLRGGDAAIDLLDRLIDLVVAGSEGRDLGAADLGVPGYLVTAYLDLSDADRTGLRRRERTPRPQVVLDPWSGIGPTLVLPALANRDLGTRWTVLGGGAIRSFDVSLRASTSIELDPHGPWQVDLGDPDSGGRSFQFQGLAGLPVLTFDTGSGHLLRDQHRITQAEVDLVLHRGLVAQTRDGASLGRAESFPELSGGWSHFRTLRISAADLGTIELVPRDEQSTIRGGRITVHGGVERPRLVDLPVSGVSGTDGRPVFAAVPDLWVPVADGVTVVVVVNGVRSERPANTLTQPDGSHSLASLIPSGSVAAVELSVRGQLGGDLRDAGFLVVPGLTVERPSWPLGPAETTTMEVSVDPGVILGATGASTAAVDVEPGTESVAVVVHGQASRIDLRVEVPRVQWVATAASSRGVLGGAPVTLSPEDLADGMRLAVRTGQECVVRLDLVGGGGTLQQLGPVTTGPDGRWSFDLRALSDTVRLADRPELALRLDVDGQVHPIGSVVARYVISELAVESLVDADAGVTLLILRFAENRWFARRELRLWSTTRPWEPPVRFAIPDDVRSEFEVFAGAEVLPGEYLAEIDVVDDWVPARRPQDGPDARRVVIGSESDRAVHLRTLDPAAGTDALELILENSPRLGRLPDDAVASSSGELLDAFTSFLVPPTKRTLGDRRYQRLRELLLQTPDLLARAVPEHLARPGRDEIDAARLSIALACDAFDCPFEEATDSERRRLYRSAPILAAAADSWTADRDAADRWADQFGWDPTGGLPEEGVGIDDLVVLMNKSPHSLHAIREALEIDDTRPLTESGFRAAMFSWLASSFLEEHRPTRQWQGAYGRLNDARIRLDGRVRPYLEALTPSGKVAGGARFPADVLAAALHLIRFGGERDAATVALWKAYVIAPALVERSILLAIALNRS